ncbi:unnamed protein product, partial [Mesorhabditis belari]|uniref:Uncharacterized protein n=1 Tax=Mesorhabditis belari TaxID=2138241 RepID=A0AAF3EG09_9BILA
MAVRLGVFLPEWACSLGDDMDSDQLFQGVFGFYQLIFGKNILENDMREKVVRSLVKHLIIKGADRLEDIHSIEDPREHDFEASPMVRLFVHRVAFRVKPMNKLITVTLTNFLTDNFFLPSVENLDALTYRLGAAAQLTYLTDASLMETSKKKAKPAQNQQTEGVRQLLSLLRDRLSELIQRDGKTIEMDNGSQAQSQINNEGLLSQVKRLIEFEEPTAFDE